MIKNRNSLKGKVSNLSNKTNIPNKYLIQNFMFEALLKRISMSDYKDKFIIKGGFLLSSIFLKNAIINTAKNRESLNYIVEACKYIELITNDSKLKSLWNNYKNNYEYAKNISFEDTINAIKIINEIIVS